MLDDAFAVEALPKRSIGAHKWGVGGLVIIGGGPGFIGAPALCAMAANRAGAGIITMAVPRSAMAAIATLVPEAVYIPMPEGDAQTVAKRAVELIAPKLEKSRAVVVGPGLGDDEYADAFLSLLFGIQSVHSRAQMGFAAPAKAVPTAAGTPRIIGGEKPAVVDADALNWLAKQPEWWTIVPPGTLVLTPHVGEMSRLLGWPTDAIIADPAGAAVEAATRWHQVVVLKYGYSVVTDGTAVLVADDAPTSLATAGTGDVLAGTIGAFLTQGLAPLQAAGLALYAGARAARRVEQRVGTLGLVASDLPIAIAETLCWLESQRGSQHG
jgi:NAD(P)H-hydrate epimerase